MRLLCVCGHPDADHISTPASVPLVGMKAIYPLPSTPLNYGIQRTNPTANYEQQLCACGCSLWTPDEGCGYTPRY